MNKAEKMKKIALSVKDLFKRKGSFDDKQVYRSCLSRIKIEAARGKLECTFLIHEYDYNNVDTKTVATWLIKDGFEVSLEPFYPCDIHTDVEDIEDWKMEVSWR